MLGLRSLRRFTLWRGMKWNYRGSNYNEDLEHRQQLSSEQQKALKLRMELIQTGNKETYVELVNTLQKIQDKFPQVQLYTHPVFREVVSEEVAEFAKNNHKNVYDWSLFKYWFKLLFLGLATVALIYELEQRKKDKEDKDKNKNSEKKGVVAKVNSLFSNISNRKNPDVQLSTNIKERFSDVLGIDQFKQQLEEIVDFIKNRNKYLEIGAKLPKGILMVGPPGTGKTLMGRALAGEAGSNFIYKSGSDFDKRYVGQGSREVKKLFKLVEKGKPTIIFIDEIDSLAGKRSANSPSFTRDTLNQLLQELDGFETKDNVIIIGATNHKQSIDPALLRPGRFDKVIHVPMPDQKGRLALLNYYIKKIKHEAIDTEVISKKVIGFSGADIKNLTNLAILHAIRNDRKQATSQDFESSITRIRMGVGRKSMYVSDEDKLMTALHEIGHAFTSIKTKGATPFNMVTILPRGPALGFTSLVPEHDTYSMTKQQMEASIDCLMGGRAAEQLFFGDSKVTTGCGSDLSKATQIAYEYNKNYGMNPKVGLLSQGEDNDENATSDKFNSSIDREVNVMLKQSYQRVLKLLNENKMAIEGVAKKLVEKETMSVQDVKKLLNI